MSENCEGCEVCAPCTYCEGVADFIWLDGNGGRVKVCLECIQDGETESN